MCRVIYLDIKIPEVDRGTLTHPPGRPREGQLAGYSWAIPRRTADTAPAPAMVNAAVRATRGGTRRASQAPTVTPHRTVTTIWTRADPIGNIKNVGYFREPSEVTLGP